MGLSLSTSWNAFRQTCAKHLLFEIEALGFKEIELSFNLDSKMLSELEQEAKNRALRITSLHNYCPMPKGLRREEALPDCFSMASLDESERQLSIVNSKVTIDTAARIGAKAVVLHTGRVEIPDKTRKLGEMLENKLTATPEFIKLRDQIKKERDLQSKPYLDNAIKSLNILADYAQAKGICLGIETRYYYREIPTFEEIGIILETLKGSSIFYWHDTGHAQFMENLGFNRHKDFLDNYASRMLGIHLHNIRASKDHQAPICGEFDTFAPPKAGLSINPNVVRGVDFKMLKPYIKPDTLKVIEAHYPATAREISESKKMLEGLFNE